MERQRFESNMRTSSSEAVPTKSRTVFEFGNLDFNLEEWEDFVDSLEAQKEYYQQFLNLWEEIFKKYPCLEYLKDQYNETKHVDSSGKQKVLSELQVEGLEPELAGILSEFAFFGASSYVDFLKKKKNSLNSINKEQLVDFTEKINHALEILKQTFEIVSRTQVYWKAFKFERSELSQTELFPEDEQGQFKVNWDFVEQNIKYTIEDAADRKYEKKKSLYVKMPGEPAVLLLGSSGIKNLDVLLNVHNLEEISQQYDSIQPRPNKGLLRVKNNKSFGYISTSGKEIIKPEADGNVPEYYNGCKLVSDGIKVANAETGEVLFKIEPKTQRVFLSGNVFVISTELSQVGTKHEYKFEIRNFNNQPIELGQIDDFVEITNRYDSVPYKSGRERYGFFVTGLSLAFKAGDRYGLLDSLSGQVVKQAACDKIERFYGGSEWKDKKQVDKNYILIQTEGKLELLDENFYSVFSQKYNTFEELENAFDEKFPGNNRKRFIAS